MSSLPQLTYISTSTPGATTTINLTSLSADYTGFRIYFDQLRVGSGGTLKILCSTDNGGSWDNGAKYATNNRRITTTQYQRNIQAISVSTGYFLTETTSTTYNLQGYVDILYTQRSNQIVTFSGSAENVGGDLLEYDGEYMSLADVDAIQLLSSVNFSGGSIYLYGIT